MGWFTCTSAHLAMQLFEFPISKWPKAAGSNDHTGEVARHCYSNACFWVKEEKDIYLE